MKKASNGRIIECFFYNVLGKQGFPFRPTYVMDSWKEVQGLGI